MKHSEFTELCQREWSQPNPGDVVAVNLTGESLAEWTADLIGTNGGAPGDVVVGASVTKVVNPVTRSIVAVAGGADTDSATAKCAPDWSIGPEPVLRVIPIGQPGASAVHAAA